VLIHNPVAFIIPESARTINTMGLFRWKQKTAQQPSPPPPDVTVASGSNIQVRNGGSIQTTLNIWEKAYDSLKIKEEELVNAYESILSRELKGELLNAGK
jgi:hypothetical protein